MPKIGGSGSAPRPKPAKTTVKQKKADTVLHGTGQSTTGGVRGQAATVQNYNTTATSGFTEEQNAPARTAKQLHNKIQAQHAKADAKIAANRKANTDKFGFNSKPSGGTATGGGSVGGSLYRRMGGDANKGIPESGGVGDRLRGSFSDPDIVGSHNDITEFDGSQFAGGGFDDVEGGGGGSGSSLAGRESVGRVGDTTGQSLDEVVYGVQKRGRKVGRARGE